MSTSPQPAGAEISSRRVLKGGAIVAGGLLAAQFAGFLRQATVGYLLGTGPDADAFAAALAPLELWWTVLALAVIFGFAPKMADPAAPGALTFRQIFDPVARFSLLSAAFVLVFAQPIVLLFAPGMSAESAESSALLLRTMAPALVFVGRALVYSALLLSQRRFLLPSLHQAVVNAATIVGALALHARLGVLGFAVGYLGGAALHLAVCRFVTRGWRAASAGIPAGPPIRLGTLLEGPAPILSQALATELNTAVSRAYASTFGSGMTAAFDYGFRLFRVPLALLVVPLSQSLLPELSALESTAERRRIAGRAMRRAAWVTLAAGALLIAAMAPFHGRLVALLFERGQFGAASTRAVSGVLLGYLPSIVGRGLLDLLSRTLYGLGVYRSPLAAAVLALALNAAICAVLPSVDPRLIGLGAVVGFSAGAWLVVREVWRFDRQKR